MNSLDILLVGVCLLGQFVATNLHALGQNYEKQKISITPPVESGPYECSLIVSSAATNRLQENAEGHISFIAANPGKRKNGYTITTGNPLIVIPTNYNKASNEDDTRKSNISYNTEVDSIRNRHFYHHKNFADFQHFKHRGVHHNPSTKVISINDRPFHSQESSHVNFDQLPTNSHASFSSHHFLPISTEVIPSVNADRVTINQNFQISQIGGNQNAVSQVQESKGNFIVDRINQNSQTSQIFGNNNAVTQARASHERYDDLLRAPYLIHMEIPRKNWPDCLTNRKRRSTISRGLVKRSIFTLITDRNSKLDVPKTLRNAELVFNSTLKNERAPVFHLRNLVGSTKDALISTLNIIPSEAGIPSKYKIITEGDRKKIDNANRKSLARFATKKSRGKHDDQFERFESAYGKLGSALRESFVSGRTTLDHLNDAYESAKRAVSFSGDVVPNIIVKSFRIPVVKRRFARNLPETYVGTRNRQNVERTTNFLDDVKTAVGVSCKKDFMIQMKRQIFNPSEEISARHFESKGSNSLKDNTARSLDTRQTMDVLSSLNRQTDNPPTDLKMSDDLKNERGELLKSLSKDKTDSVSRKGLVLDEKLFEPFMNKASIANERLSLSQNFDASDESRVRLDRNEFAVDQSGKRTSIMTMGEPLITPYMGKIKKTNDNYSNRLEIEPYESYDEE